MSILKKIIITYLSTVEILSYATSFILLVLLYTVLVFGPLDKIEQKESITEKVVKEEKYDGFNNIKFHSFIHQSK